MKILSDFFNQNGYVFELILCTWFFVGWMKKRDKFFVKLVKVVLVLVGASMLWEMLLPDNITTLILKTSLFFLLNVCGIRVCYCAETLESAFYAIAVGATQHFSYKMAKTITFFIGIRESGYHIPFGVSYPVIFVLSAVGCYLMFGKKLRKEGKTQKTSSVNLLFLLFGMQLFTNVFQNILGELEVEVWIYTLFNFFDFICCLFLIALQCEIVIRENEQVNNEIMKHILYQQKQQMQVSKETIEMINIKCHDIKNQLSLLENKVPQNEIEELKKVADIYNTAVKTGNEALDVLLMEKMMLCNNKNIHIDCAVKAEQLSFMKQEDIYSLFGNVLDNAIEAVDKLSDPEKRLVSIRIKNDKGMIVIHEENYYEGEMVFKDGLPETTKEDRFYHGFGMKSIRMITEKYNGYYSVKTENNKFFINILIPVSW